MLFGLCYMFDCLNLHVVPIWFIHCCFVDFIYKPRLSVKVVITNSEETLAYAENITARIAAKKASKENVKDVDVAMERARKSCVAPSNRAYSTMAPDNIPRSYSGTWSNNTTGPRATVIKV